MNYRVQMILILGGLSSRCTTIILECSGNLALPFPRSFGFSNVEAERHSLSTRETTRTPRVEVDLLWRWRTGARPHASCLMFAAPGIFLTSHHPDLEFASFRSLQKDHKPLHETVRYTSQRLSP